MAKHHKSAHSSEHDTPSPQQAFAAPPGQVDVTTIPTDSFPVGPTSKDEAAVAMADLAQRLSSLQERLFAKGVAGGQHRVLLLLQGMDTAGKDGVIKHVVGMVDPGGVRIASFKKPTADELAHDFLWRIENQVPPPGYLGVFNRSQYEDVLVVRVHELVPKPVWSQRYSQINEFERRITDSGVSIVKCFLHISRATQSERLLARLDDPTKYWKYNPGDIDERGYWDAYQQAYSAAISECSTIQVPWFVIPSDRKWYRNWAVAALLTQALERIDPQYPPAAFDVDVEKKRVAAS